MSRGTSAACCWACKGPLGLCLNHLCEHHVAAEKQDEANERARQTVRRPTEEQAINNVMRAQRARKTTPKRPFNYPKEDR